MTLKLTAGKSAPYASDIRTRPDAHLAPSASP